MVVLLRVLRGARAAEKRRWITQSSPVVYLPIGYKRAARDCTNPSKSLLRERYGHERIVYM